MTEAELQSAILEVARWNGWKVYHTHNSRRSQPGFPDLILIRDGTMLAWELKSDTGRVTAEQWDWIHAFAGVTEVGSQVIYPDDYDDAINLLSARH